MNGQDGTGRDAVDARTADGRVLTQLIERAGSPGFEHWWASVTDSGYCTTPVHLHGTDRTGHAAHVLARCKNRRAAICPSCSRLYAGDTWQLVHRGLPHGRAGDDAVVRPTVFATFTAPSFGAVHRLGSCHPPLRRSCIHGRPLGCGVSHQREDALIGAPLCPQCYDYVGHVLFTWHAPELWHRYTIALRRALRRRLRERASDPASVRLSYVKIVELQQRGIPHYHAIFRLDADDEQTVPMTSEQLAGLIVRAAGAARLRVPGADDTVTSVRFGQQVDTQSLYLDSARSCAIAGYLAKYVTKSVADLGLTHRRLSPAAIERLDLSEHVRRILHTLVYLSAHSDRREMVRWLHTLGYRGHVSSKTRRYSTTLTALRAQRASWHGDSVPGPERTWRYVGHGYASDGDRLLVVSAAQRAIEQQQAARESLREAQA